jgi:hypothetical protein
MKYILGVFFFATIFSVNTNAQTTTTVAKPQKFMLITTIESVIEGGLGRSRMLITAHIHIVGTRQKVYTT